MKKPTLSLGGWTWNQSTLFALLLLLQRSHGESQCVDPVLHGPILAQAVPPTNSGPEQLESSQGVFYWKEQAGACVSTSTETYVSVLMSAQAGTDTEEEDDSFLFESGNAVTQNKWAGMLPNGDYSSFMFHGDKQGANEVFEFEVTFCDPIAAIVYRNRPGKTELCQTDPLFGSPTTTYSGCASSRQFELDGANNWMRVSADRKTLKVKAVIQHNMDDIRVITPVAMDLPRVLPLEVYPHFVTFGGDKYDFHGECDLVLVNNPSFFNGLGMRVHVRTKIQTWWSYIEAAVIQIGNQTLEVVGGKKSIQYWLNGKAHELVDAEAFLGDFPIKFNRVLDHQSKTYIALGHGGDAISIESYKHFVRVSVKAPTRDHWKHSNGLLGAFPEGTMIGRDGSSVFVSANEFGNEWQVRPTDGMLFQEESAIQHPKKCLMPDQTQKSQKRRLGEITISEEEAALACARVAGGDRDACIFDVMATNDKDMAGSY